MMTKLHLSLLSTVCLFSLSACGAKDIKSKEDSPGIGEASDSERDDSVSTDDSDSDEDDGSTQGNDDSDEDDKGSSKDDESSTGDKDNDDDSDTTTNDDGAGDSGNEDGGGDPGDADEVCKRWNKDTSNKSEGMWSGSVADCKAGDIDKETRARTLAQVNLMRWLADLPPVTTDPEYDRKAQECALMMDANNTLSHTPPDSWKCYTKDGAEGAMRSNISSGPGVMSVMAYMVDDGNHQTIGHRRWILANNFGPTGLGSTSGASCMWTMGGKGTGTRKWTAWPPPGVFPLEAGRHKWGNDLDGVGWTIQSDTIDFNGKTITVTVDGKEKSVTTANLLPWYGSRHAVKINPQGWKMQDGSTYRVKVEGTDIDYKFTVKKCG